MPKSRGRRPKHNRKRRPRQSRPSAAAARERAEAEFPLLQATDAAEARGDAGAALEIIARDLERRGAEFFWRPDRIRRLVQIVALGELLPRWATSRWVLAQAAQWLGPRGRPNTRRAIAVALATRGDEVMPGLCDMDVSVKVMDHDWVFRQVLLYELGGIRDFIAFGASPDLLAGADRIHDWMRAPMGGYRFEQESPRTLTWTDLANGVELTCLNIGAASLLQPGECAIGRLVPIQDGAMFETAPLFVPDDVAQDVADRPGAWVSALSAGCRSARESGEPIQTDKGHGFGLLTDVPTFVQQVVALGAFEKAIGRHAPIATVADVEAVKVALIRAALDERLSEGTLPVDPWPSVAAMLLDPYALEPLHDSLHPTDVSKLLRLAAMLPDPAGEVCRVLASQLDAAA